mgnify:CR=1 FL=1
MSIQEKILRIKPDGMDSVELAKNILVSRGENSIRVTRYFALHGKARAWCIQCGKNIEDWSKVGEAFKECKALIAEERRYTTPMHGMTHYL